MARVCQDCGSPLEAGVATRSAPFARRVYQPRGWPAFRLAVVCFAGGLVGGQLAVARVFVPALLKPGSIADLGGLRATLTLLLLGMTFAAGSWSVC